MDFFILDTSGDLGKQRLDRTHSLQFVIFACFGYFDFGVLVFNTYVL